MFFKGKAEIRIMFGFLKANISTFTSFFKKTAAARIDFFKMTIPATTTLQMVMVLAKAVVISI